MAQVTSLTQHNVSFRNTSLETRKDEVFMQCQQRNPPELRVRADKVNAGNLSGRQCALASPKVHESDSIAIQLGDP